MGKQYQVIAGTSETVYSAEKELSSVAQFRVHIQPEDLIALRQGKAIIFTVNSNEYSIVIHSNPDGETWKRFSLP